MDRREFLKRMGAGAAFALLGTAGLAGCTTLPGERLPLGGRRDRSDLTALGVNDPALDDLLEIIKGSPEFRRIRSKLREEDLTSAWYEPQTSEAALATVVFTLDGRINKPDQFLVFPYAAFLVEHLDRRVVDVVIGRVDQGLKHVNLKFLKNAKYSKKVKLHERVAQTLKAAKQKALKGKSQNHQAGFDLVKSEGEVGPECHGWHCVCIETCGGYIDDICAYACNFACAVACPGVTPLQRAACAAGCLAACSLACYVPEYCCDWDCVDPPQPPNCI